MRPSSYPSRLVGSATVWQSGQLLFPFSAARAQGAPIRSEWLAPIQQRPIGVQVLQLCMRQVGNVLFFVWKSRQQCSIYYLI